jgi:hypothetical protein
MRSTSYGRELGPNGPFPLGLRPKPPETTTETKTFLIKVGVGLAVSANNLSPFQIEQKGPQNKPLRFECGPTTKTHRKSLYEVPVMNRPDRGRE